MKLNCVKIYKNETEVNKNETEVNLAVNKNCVLITYKMNFVSRQIFL